MTMALVLVSCSCASPAGQPEVMVIQPHAAAAPRSDGYEEILAAAINALQREVGLPRVEVPLILFANEGAFERGLIQIGYTETLARSASSFNAIGGAAAVLVNGGSIRRLDRGRRMRLIAHELVHSIQYHLGGGTRGASEQWLREGFAEWAACRATASLGFGSFESLRGELIDQLAGVPLGRRPVPFEHLQTFPQWVEAQSRFDVPLYPQAFVAAELLVEHHGVPAVIRYFEYFKTSKDHRRAFREAFGIEPQAFERRFLGHWQQTLARANAMR